MCEEKFMVLISPLKRLASRLYGYLREAIWYVRHLVMGSSYSEYYADHMNRIVARNPNWGLNLNRIFQFEYLKTHGLTPQSNLLDYGCGALAAGIHFVGFLEPGKYVGLDISKAVLCEGTRRLAHAGLSDRKPSLHLLNGDRASGAVSRCGGFPGPARRCAAAGIYRRGAS